MCSAVQEDRRLKTMRVREKYRLGYEPYACDAEWGDIAKAFLSGDKRLLVPGVRDGSDSSLCQLEEFE